IASALPAPAISGGFEVLNSMKVLLEGRQNAVPLVSLSAPTRVPGIRRRRRDGFKTRACEPDCGRDYSYGDYGDRSDLPETRCQLAQPLLPGRHLSRRPHHNAVVSREGRAGLARGLDLLLHLVVRGALGDRRLPSPLLPQDLPGCLAGAALPCNLRCGCPGKLGPQLGRSPPGAPFARRRGARSLQHSEGLLVGAYRLDLLRRREAEPQRRPRSEGRPPGRLAG